MVPGYSNQNDMCVPKTEEEYAIEGAFLSETGMIEIMMRALTSEGMDENIACRAILAAFKISYVYACMSAYPIIPNMTKEDYISLMCLKAALCTRLTYFPKSFIMLGYDYMRGEKVSKENLQLAMRLKDLYDVVGGSLNSEYVLSMATYMVARAIAEIISSKESEKKESVIKNA